MRHFFTGLDQTVSSSAVPYGFTLTIWCTGAFLMESHSTPTELEIVLFAGGGIIAFGVMRALSARVRTGSTQEIGESRHWVRAGVVHTLAIASALSAAAPLAHLHSRAAWTLAPAAAVALYLGVSSVEMALLCAEADD